MIESMKPLPTTLRIARPSRDLRASERFWVEGLGPEVLFRADSSTEGGHALLMVATDLAFAVGWGPEVRGPAEALLMTIAGRRRVAGELCGPGQRKLARRIDGR